MTAYKITIGQKNSIEKPEKYNGVFFNPRQDINGDWFIWQVEFDFCQEHFGWTATATEFTPPEPPQNPEI